MSSLRIYVGEKLAEEFDLLKVTNVEFTESQRSIESTGGVLREQPPRPDISICSIKTDDGRWYAFYDYDGRTIRGYSLAVLNAKRDNQDLEIFFPVEHNPRYTNK